MQRNPDEVACWKAMITGPARTAAIGIVKRIGLVYRIFTNENGHENSTGQRETVEYHLAEAL